MAKQPLGLPLARERPLRLHTRRPWHRLPPPPPRSRLPPPRGARAPQYARPRPSARERGGLKDAGAGSPPPRTMASRNDPSLCDCTVCHAYRLIWTDARGRTVTQQRQSGSCNGDVHVRVPARVSLPRFRRSYQHLVHGTSVNPAKEREWAHDGSPVTNPQTSPPHLRQRDGAIGL